MGYCYYLIREDNRTCFELGKHVGDWAEYLGDWRSPIVLLPEHEETLTLVLAQLMPDVPTHYPPFVAKSIINWSEGQPFYFAGEETREDYELTGSRYR